MLSDRQKKRNVGLCLKPCLGMFFGTRLGTFSGTLLGSFSGTRSVRFSGTLLGSFLGTLFGARAKLRVRHGDPSCFQFIDISIARVPDQVFVHDLAEIYLFSITAPLCVWLKVFPPTVGWFSPPATHGPIWTRMDPYIILCCF